MVGLCSVAHVEVTANSAQLTSNLKAVGADDTAVDITYTYSVSFVVSLHLLTSVILVSGC